MARETAWSSWEEWRFVKELLFSLDDYQGQMEGIHYVEMWKSRLRNGLFPVAIELTTTLVVSHIAINQDSELNIYKNSESRNRHQVHLSAAMAIVRFVNGITDQFQSGLYAQSVQLIAEKIDIPDWMVDLRHEIAHAQLPSMDIISSGITFALNWLHENYWEETSLKIREQQQTVYANITKNVHSYGCLVVEAMSTAKNTITTKETKKAKNKTKDKHAIVQIILKLTNQGNFKTVLSFLAQSSHFVLSKQQAQEIGFSQSTGKVDEEDYGVLTKLVALWKPLLVAMQEKYNSFIELLTKAVISRAEIEHCDITLYLLCLVHPSSHKGMVGFLLKFPSESRFQILKSIANQGTFQPNLNSFLMTIISTFGNVVRVLSKNYVGKVDWQNSLQDKATSTKYADLIASMKFSFDEASTEQKTPKWRLLSPAETEALPPLGELPDDTCTQDLNLRHRIVKVLSIYTPEIPQDTVVKLTSDTVDKEYFRCDLVGSINAMFSPDYCLHVESDTSDDESCTTEEYNEDQDMPWDENVMVLRMKDEEKGFIQKIETSTLDVSKIVFF